jgi:RHS repeat-associated protein
VFKINARGQRIEYDYADWGPVAEERHYADAAGTNLLRTQTFTYNLDGALEAASDDAVQAGDLYTLVYDALGRPDSETVHYIPGGDISLDYGYDRYGNRDGLTLDDGAITTYGYVFDPRNRLTAATLPGAHQITYTEADERNTIAFPNGVTTTYTYALNGPIDTITTRTSSLAVLEAWDYSHDAVLNIEDITTSDGLTDYQYDGVDRLTAAVYPPSGPLTDESYDYDRVGNREDPLDPNAYDYDGNNQITDAPGLSYTFDADGNLTGRSDGAMLTYDVTNRLISFVGSATGDYRYEPNGRRIAKTVNGTQTTWFLWDGTQLLAEYDNAGSQIKRYAYLPGDLAPSEMEDMIGTYSVHSDHLQTPKLVTDGSEQIVWMNRMQAFGEATVDEDPDGDGTDLVMNIRFPGQYADSESGLRYNYLRSYDPTTGRYIESDPIGLDGGLNPYVYSYSNPVTYFDLYGLDPSCTCHVFCLTVPVTVLVECTSIEVCEDDCGQTTVARKSQYYVWATRTFHFVGWFTCEEFPFSLPSRNWPIPIPSPIEQPVNPFSPSEA